MMTHRSFSVTHLPLLVFGALLLAALAIDVSFLRTADDGSHTIELRENGFSPTTLTIREGDTVTFKAIERAGWPASDPHPTHEYLGGFDANQVIPVGESWSYTFDEPGTWRYHDHEAPSLQGVVVVRSAPADISARDTDVERALAGKCVEECFDALMRRIVENNGVAVAIDLFQRVHQTGVLTDNCHWTAHAIGEAAYELFKVGEEFPITEAMSYCAYGFYHGFLETLLRENPDVEYALSFCDRVEKVMGDEGRGNCYHGIGHGFTEDPPDPRVHGDFQAMIEPGIEMCEYLFEHNIVNRLACLTGVYAVPTQFAIENEHGLSIDSDDPFVLCRTQPIEYQSICYGEFAYALDELADHNLANVPRYVELLPDTPTKLRVIWRTAHVMMAKDISDDSHVSYVLGCREGFSKPFRDACIGGTINSFFRRGVEGEQYKLALRLCAEEVLADDERETCYTETFSQMSQRYSREEMERVCDLVPEPYSSSCVFGASPSVYRTISEQLWQRELERVRVE